MEKGRKMIYIGNAKKIPVGEARKFLYPVGDGEGNRETGHTYTFGGRLRGIQRLMYAYAG